MANALVLGVAGATAGASALIAPAANGPGSASPFSFLNHTPFAGHTGRLDGFGGDWRGGQHGDNDDGGSNGSEGASSASDTSTS